MAETNEMACVYAALVLHDDSIPITEDKIKSLVDAAGVKIEPYMPAMFARLLQSVNIEDLINNIGAAPAAGASGGAAAGGAAKDDGAEEEKKEEAKEESEEEEEEDMDFDLFD